jgi:hypothetical protein
MPKCVLVLFSTRDGNYESSVIITELVDCVMCGGYSQSSWFYQVE